MTKAAEGGAGQWVKLSTKIIYQSHWLELRCDETVLPEGSRGRYDHVVVPGSVTVLAVDDDGRVAITRQWIYPHAETQWRLPAGRIEPADPTPEAAARRELQEETGITAERLQGLGIINCADSFTNHREHAFLATGLIQGSPDLQPGEADLELTWLPFGRVLAMVADGEIPHAGSAFAVLATKVGGILDLSG
ncbi:NUDIX hydrolase [Kribbella sp. NPDC026596]|uniref:NUDIX hydrolase n=1 Tax=Kribbella sp. NPDC026596 TaxID=3155122 RepID=UPI0034092A93